MTSTKEFANKLVRESVAIKSYSLWKDTQFRELIGFYNLTNKQQDKIFNDLQLASLLYVLLFLEDRAKKSGDLNSVVYANIGEYVFDSFLNMMRDVNLTNKQINLWKKLINLREREYKQDLKYIIKESKKWDIFNKADKKMYEAWGGLATISLGVLRHIKRDYKYSSKDRLWRLIRKWLVSIEVELVNIFKDTDMYSIKVLN